MSVAIRTIIAGLFGHTDTLGRQKCIGCEETHESGASRAGSVLGRNVQMKVQDITEGPIEERAAAVFDCLLTGWMLIPRDPSGAHLIDPKYNQIFVVTRDVVEFLLGENLIKKPDPLRP